MRGERGRWSGGSAARRRSNWPGILVATLAAAIIVAMTRTTTPTKALEATVTPTASACAAVADDFDFALSNYLTYAFPHDSTRPVACDGTSPHVGGVGLSAVDALDSVRVVMEMAEGNQSARARTLMRTCLGKLATLKHKLLVDEPVSVFETNIRIVGGLVAGHLAAEHLLTSNYPASTNINLLHLAVGVAERLLPAFATPTGIPYGTVNLAYGHVPPNETPVTSTASAGTFLLEFAALSRLTGDARFERVARRAARALFVRRFPLTGLLGSHIDVRTGEWTQPDSSVGSHMDSYLENLLKYHVLFHGEEELAMFLALYTAYVRHTKVGPFYARVLGNSGGVVSTHLEALQVYFPGMQVLWGDRAAAVDTLRAIGVVFSKYAALPDVLNFATGDIVSGAAPLRPEFLESLWYASRAVPPPGDHVFRVLGSVVVDEMRRRSRKACGFAGLVDVRAGPGDDVQDLQESFFLAETLKYASLLLCEESPTAVRATPTARAFEPDAVVLTTEGHALPMRLPAGHPRYREWAQPGNVVAALDGPGGTHAIKTLMETLAMRVPHLRRCPSDPALEWRVHALELFDVPFRVGMDMCTAADVMWHDVGHWIEGVMTSPVAREALAVGPVPVGGDVASLHGLASSVLPSAIQVWHIDADVVVGVLFGFLYAIGMILWKR